MTFKKIASLALAVLMLCTTLCACASSQGDNTSGNPTTTKPSSDVEQNETALYQVTVYGVDGKPATSGVFVKFLQNGEQVAMQNTNVSGVAEKELEKGDYTVELMFSGGTKYYFDTSDLTLSKTKTQLTINLCLEQSTESETVYVDEMEYIAYSLSTGNTYVTLKPGRNYFLYYPEQSGEYEMWTANGTYKVGYYGGVHYIMPNDAGTEAPNNGTHVSISASMISDNSFVIGVDNPGTEDVKTVLQVVRASEYVDTTIPKQIYQATHTLTPWKKPADVTVKQFNIRATQPYNLVLDETTGFYHLNDVNGPLVVVFLGEVAREYMDYMAPYETVLQNSGVTVYFGNEDGTYDRCEVYSNCLQEYIGAFDANLKDPVTGAMGTYVGGCMDRESGMYPLTEDLMYIIKNHGNYAGWWDSSDPRYIFEGITVNPENAWLFMCGYLETM
jgi:hypothetical protein